MERGRPRNRSRSRSKDRSRSPRGRDRSRDRPSNARVAEKRVYISNIPYDVRWQDIKDLMRKEVGEVAFVELFVDESEKPRGCGIIEFENAALAKKAIEKMHRHELSGRKIVVKEDYDVERDKAGRIITPGTRRDRERSRERDRGDWDRGRRDDSPNPGRKQVNTYGLSQQFLETLGIEGPLVSKVFVSNLEFRVDEKKLKEVFKLAGKVVEVDLNKDKDGKSRGFAVIEYEHPVEAVQAISMFNNQELFDRRMHVRMDRLSDPLADLLKNRLPEGLKNIGMGLGPNGQPLVDVSKTLANSNTIATNVAAMNVIGSGQTPFASAITNANALTAMNVGGMNVGLTSGVLGSQGMDGLGSLPVQTGNAFGVQLGALNTSNQFGGAATAGLVNQVAAGNLSALGNLGLTQGNQLSQLMQNQLNSTGGANSNSSQFQSTGARDVEYGYSTSSVYSTPSSNYNTAYQREKQQFGNGNSDNTNNFPSNTLIMSNLPPTCTWQMLKAKCRDYGEVVFAEMRDKSTGIVRFSSEREAERAVKLLDQSRVDGRIVDVRYL